MKSRSESGSTLLWAIGVLVLLSVVGAMISQMSPSSLQGKLEQEAGMRQRCEQRLVEALVA